MPYRTYDKRVSNYEKAIDPTVVSTKFTNRKDLMVAGQQEMQAELVDMEQKVRGVLDDEGILGNFRIPYLNFARALFRAKGHNSGVALQKIATAEKSKFTSLGLDPAVLDKIIYLVIGVPAY